MPDSNISTSCNSTHGKITWLEDERGINKMLDLKKQGLFHAIGISLNRWEPWNGVKAVKSGSY